jgi:hypothetical protein
MNVRLLHNHELVKDMPVCLTVYILGIRNSFYSITTGAEIFRHILLCNLFNQLWSLFRAAYFIPCHHFNSLKVSKLQVGNRNLETVTEPFSVIKAQTPRFPIDSHR